MDVKAHQLANKRIIVASNRLPVKVDRKEGQLEGSPAVGGVAKSLSSFHHGNESLLVDWCRLIADNGDDLTAGFRFGYPLAFVIQGFKDSASRSHAGGPAKN